MPSLKNHGQVLIMPYSYACTYEHTCSIKYTASSVNKNKDDSMLYQPHSPSNSQVIPAESSFLRSIRSSGHINACVFSEELNDQHGAYSMLYNINYHNQVRQLENDACH